jgi:hypothetical protein
MSISNRITILFLGLTGLISLLTLPVQAANISQAYQSDTEILVGSIVSIDPDRADNVEPANTTNGSRLLGVAVGKDDTLLAVDAKAGAVQIATNGTVNVLVSTLNGEVKAGDQVAVSPFNGIGMKAEAGSHVIGLAQTTLGASGLSSQQVTDKSGRNREVKVGSVRISIAISVNNTGVGSGKINSLQRLARNLTGRTISTARIVLSMIIAVVALITLATLIYGSIYGSIISVGRNPLAKYAILRMLFSVLGLVTLTALTATVMIYFLLR